MTKQILKLALATLLMAPMGAMAQSTTIASWNQGTIEGGTWTALGTAQIEGYTSKYNANATTVTCMTFPNSYNTDDAGAITNAVKLEGDFKKGDVVTLQPFTVMSNTDFTGGSKYANIEIRNSENQALYNTGSAGGALTVTDGHEEAGEPKEFSYTLSQDYSELYFGRYGNSRINVMKIVVERPQKSATITVTDALYATFGNNTGATMSVPEGLTAYGVSAIEEDNVVFSEYNVIPDGVGVILKAEAEGEYTLELTEIECAYEGDNLLVAVTEDMTLPAKKSGKVNYIFANKDQGVGFYLSSGEGTIAKGKAYLSIVDKSADNRSWDFTSFSEATVDDLETERQMADGSDATTAGTAVDGELWIMGVAENNAYRYKNVGALSNAELVANGNTIAETAGLLFTAKNGKLGIDCRSTTTQVFLDGTATTITIADLKADHTVTITARTSSSSAAAYMTCSDETNVTRTGDTGSTASVDNVFTILAGGTYTFAPSRSINVTKIVIAPIEGAETAEARPFFGFADDDDTTTAISEIENRKTENRKYYDLQGRPITQLKPGIYVKDGKKIVIK